MRVEHVAIMQKGGLSVSGPIETTSESEVREPIINLINWFGLLAEVF